MNRSKTALFRFFGRERFFVCHGSLLAKESAINAPHRTRKRLAKTDSSIEIIPLFINGRSFAEMLEA